MTMRAREQDIRREKAASNICTNQALLALAASVYLAILGPHGLRDVAALGAARAAELEAALAAVGAPRLHPGPYLNEFAVRVPDAPRVHRAPARAWRPGRARPRRGRARRSVAGRRPPGVRDRGDHRRTRSPGSRRPCPTRSTGGRRSRSRPAPGRPGDADRPAGRGRRGARPMSVTGTRLQPTHLREVQPRAGRRQDPAPAEGRARPDPRRGPARDAGCAARSSTSPRSSATTST